MTHLQSRARSNGAYPGPSREELGDLAEWITGSESPEIPDGPRATPAPVPVAEATPVRRRSRKPYPGPTRKELGDLAQWLDAGDARGSTRNQGPSTPATSLRSIEAELWVSETGTSGTESEEEPKVTDGLSPPRPSSDSFLDQLDEIQAALRKRAS